MAYPNVPAELTALLTRIQEACRAYPTQDDRARKLSFATIRTAADTIGSVAESELAGAVAEGVRVQVNAVTGALDELGDRWGSEEHGLCRACGAPLASVPVGGGQVVAYCTRCPREILDAVREISDLTGADVL